MTVLGIEFLVEGSSGGETKHNSNVDKIETFAALTVIEMDKQTPPGSPSNGDRYEVAASGTTGVFVGQENKIAAYFDGWIFFTAKEGMRLYDQNTNKLFIRNGTSFDERPLRGASVSDLNQTITNPPTVSEVQAISDKIDELLGVLRNSNGLST